MYVAGTHLAREEERHVLLLALDVAGGLRVLAVGARHRVLYYNISYHITLYYVISYYVIQYYITLFQHTHPPTHIAHTIHTWINLKTSSCTFLSSKCPVTYALAVSFSIFELAESSWPR